MRCIKGYEKILVKEAEYYENTNKTFKHDTMQKKGNIAFCFAHIDTWIRSLNKLTIKRDEERKELIEGGREGRDTTRELKAST